MASPLLSTKLYAPVLRPNLVSRPHLLKRLTAGLHRKLTLVSAPAGFGKTTLIGEWLRILERPATWLSLDEEDNDAVQFLAYLISALQQIDEHIGQAIPEVLGAPQVPPLQNLIALLINDIATAATPLVLVVDDYHLITSPSVHQALGFLLERQPPAMHTIIITREDPPFPLPRLRARGQVTEIREADLRFTPKETATFLRHTMGLPLSPEAVRALEARTEGWIAGLQLAALAVQQDTARAEAFVDAFAGDDRYIMDYLIAEVLQQQRAEMRAFLRQTSILDRLSAELCDAVTGRTDSHHMLEQLEKANLFLLPLDHRREWYRYHRLFAEFLRTRLDREERGQLHRRAAGWYQGHELTGQAIAHALAYAAASEDWTDAEQMIELAAEGTMHNGGVMTVRGWLEALPDQRVRANGVLATYKGWSLALTGEMAAAEAYIQAAVDPTQVESIGETVPAGQLLTLRAFIAVLLHQDYEGAIRLAGEALRALREDQPQWQVIALWAKAESQERTRDIAEAVDTLYQARRVGRRLQSQLFAAAVEVFLASALHSHGRRQAAMQVCQEATDWYVAPPSDTLHRTSVAAGLIYGWLGALYYEADQLELARGYLEKSMALSGELALGGELLFTYGHAVPTLHAQGETDAAIEVLHRARDLAIETGYTDPGHFLAIEARIRLQEGDLPYAARWARELGLCPDDTPEYLRLEEHLTYARLLLAQGRLPDARRWLVRLERFFKARGLYRALITAHILQALTAHRAGDRSTATARLSQAVELAAPEGYRRAFLDEDEEIMALLLDVRKVAPEFVVQLLASSKSAGQDQPSTLPATEALALVEPLTEREGEVLGLIAAGRTNREIGEELHITVGTVKRHINNLYGKLDVHTRTQAIAKARELHLLE